MVLYKDLARSGQLGRGKRIYHNFSKADRARPRWLPLKAPHLQLESGQPISHKGVSSYDSRMVQVFKLEER